MDYDSGVVLFEKDADMPTAPASMSKLMTVAIVFEKLKNGELKLTDEFSVSEKAWRMGGSKMWTRVDTTIPLQALLRGVIVQSGNDACVVIAENISGTEESFAQLMTKKGREWGLNNSTFANSTGWPDENHKMSTRDLAILARKIIHDYPEYYPLFNEREFLWEKIRQPNRNPILFNVAGADGLKTGHTEESGYGLVGSAKVDGERRIVVVNGLTSEKERATESARLLRIAFSDFTNKSLYQAGDIAGDAQVFAGKSATVPLVTAEPVSMIVHRAAADGIAAKVIYEGPIAAPIAKGQQIGYLRVQIDGGDTREYPLYAGEAVKATGIFGRIGLAAKSLLAKPAQPTAAEEQPAGN
jgi:D-alanyl-D-alanine carboxypeptidase (penicillin-binding protein 5/6)